MEGGKIPRLSREATRARRTDATKALVAILAFTPEDKKFNPVALAAELAGVSAEDALNAYLGLSTSDALSPTGSLKKDDPMVQGTLKQDPIVLGDRAIPRSDLQSIVTGHIARHEEDRVLRSHIVELGLNP